VRNINPAQYSVKRNKILDTALEIIYRKGYKDASIQDIIDALDISKGAFYHYFSSKQELLIALVERMKTAATQQLAVIAEDDSLTAIQKFNRYFEMSIRWKAENKQLTRSAIQLWYAEQNALFRQKLSTEALRYTSALFEIFIKQGLREGVFGTSYPEENALIIAGMALNLADDIAGLMLSTASAKKIEQSVLMILMAYTDSIEKILGIAPGTLNAFNKKDVQMVLSKLIES
jgi:TetR/AcrR family transcriptional regulator, transcriptional repressor for nem operon